MKMMRKNWKDRKGVSPVIATILMVAITVVLAAVLYVMVMGFGGDPNSVPTGEFKPAEKMSDGKYRIQVLSISEAKDIADMRISISDGTDTPVYVVGATAPIKSDDAIAGLTVSFTDLNGDSKVSTGDYFTVGVPSPAAGTSVSYTVALSYAPASGNGGVICDTTFKVSTPTD